LPSYILSAKYLDIYIKEEFSKVDEEEEVIVNKVQIDIYKYYLKVYNISKIVTVVQVLSF
jgi:hypothetical protein